VVRKYYGLPPLTALAVFEATARHASVKLAAKELNVTPSAVSRQIKLLEEELGVKLFIRARSGVQLSAAAQDLFVVLASSFSKCSKAIQELRAGTHVESVTFACTDAFASFWLMPRMLDFWDRYPKIGVNHLISDNTRDFRRAEVDLFVRSGKGAWSNEQAERLFGDRIYPVCGIEFAKRHPNTKITDLPTLPLLHMDWNDPEWSTWEDLLQEASISYGTLQGRRFAKYSILLMAAEANQGVAMGWDALVRSLIQRGQLVRLTELEVPAAAGYYLVWNDKRPLSEAAMIMRSWIVQQAVLMQKANQ
jgi:DNA-binding transcriptional LysR family regulator